MAQFFLLLDPDTVAKTDAYKHEYTRLYKFDLTL